MNNGADSEKGSKSGRRAKPFTQQQAYDDDDVSNSSSEQQSDEDYAWIPWFCSLKGNEFFCEVDESFARDGFNLTGLQTQVSFYEYALDMILDNEPNGIASQ